MVATLGAAAAVGIAYFLAARLGLALVFSPSDVAVFWPASGIAAGILIISGRRALGALVIGVMMGTIAANIMSDRSLLTSLLKGFCNAGEPVLVAWLLERWFGRPFEFGDLRRVAGFLTAGGLAAATSAVGGAATMTLLHPETIAPFRDVWREWFLSSWVGLVLVAPLVIGLSWTWRKPPPRKEWMEGAGVLALVIVACSYTMAQKSGSWLSFAPSAFVLPLLLWLTARCQPTFAIAGAFLASVAIIGATTFGIGRFGDPAVPVMQRVTGAQLAIMTVTLFTLVLAVLFTQRKKAEESLAKERAMLARLHEVSSRLWLKRDLKQALDEILVGAIDLLGADMGAIRILDRTRGVLKIEAQRGFTQEFLDCFGEISVDVDSPVRSTERMVITDVEKDERFTPFRRVACAAGYRAVQSTPMMSRAGVQLGTLATHFRLAQEPPDQDLRLLDLYVRQAADIIERHRADDALRESEERLRLAQLQTGIGIWDVNLRTGKLAWTPELEALFGLKPGTVKCYSDFRDRVHPEDIAAIESARVAAVRRREPYRVEYRIIRPDGQIRWIAAIGGALYDEATGKPTRIIGNNADITERKLAELALAERNAQLELASKTARVGTFVMDFHTGLVKLSPGCASIFGLPEGTAEISREYGLKLVHPEDLPQLALRRDEAFLKQQSEFVAQYRIRRVDDGEFRWMEVRGLNFYGRDGQPSRATAIIIDFTERKRAEEVLAERNLQLKLAGKAGLVGSYAYDAETETMQISEGYAALHGLPARTAELTLGQWRTRVHPDDLAAVEEYREKLFDTRRHDYTFDYRIIRDCGIRWIESRGVVSYDKDGRPKQVIGINIDITERKLAESALVERNAQLALAGAAALVGSFAYDIDTGKMQVSEGYVAIHGLRPGATETTRREWQDRVHPDDVERLNVFRNQALDARRREYNSEYRIVLADRGVRWIESRSFISYDVKGIARRVVGVNIDVTERKNAERALAEGNAQLTLAGNVAGVGYFAYDVAKRQQVAISDGYAAIYGWPGGTTQMTVDYWRTRVHPDDLAQFDQTRRRVFANRSHDHSCDFRIIRADGQIRWVDSRRFISYDGAGNPRRIIGVNIDVTERKEVEDHKSTLIAELDHRVKNVLANVSAVAARTKETSRSMAKFVTALDGRIKSMAITHELLSSRHWQGIALAELVRRELAPYATPRNTRVNGPDVVLRTEAGQVLAMVFHELATNAAKFGAISSSSGTVSVRWSLRRNRQAESWLCIRWKESGGPAVVPPSRCGYGVSVVREQVPYELGGRVDLDYLPKGVHCKLRIPAHWLKC